MTDNHTEDQMRGAADIIAVQEQDKISLRALVSELEAQLADLRAKADTLADVAQQVEHGVPHRPGWLQSALDAYRATQEPTDG